MARAAVEGGSPVPRTTCKPVWAGDHWKVRMPRTRGGKRPWIQFEPGVTEAEARSRGERMARRVREQGATVSTRRSNSPDETVTAWCDRWCAARKRAGIATVRNDRSRLATHVLPLIGKLPIALVNSDDV